MKNPHALIIFGQRYDGSNEVTVVPPIATSTDIGCVMPVDKTDEMIQDVGIDDTGKLYTKSIQIDDVVTAFSNNAVSSNGVYVYVQNNTSQINSTIEQVRSDVTQTSEQRYNELRAELTETEETIDDLKTSAIARIDELDTAIKSTNQNVTDMEDDITSLKTAQSNLNTRVTANEQNIDFNKSDIDELKPAVTQLQSDITEVKSRNIGYYFSSESAILAWLQDEENTKLLGIGVCLYITGDMQTHYVWNGTSADRVTILTEVVGGYMTSQNPTGTGYIVLNNSQTGSYGAVFGDENIAYGTYSFVAGRGLHTQNDYQSAVGKYNAESSSDELFTVGCGEDEDNRQTAHVITKDGTSKAIGDVTAFDTSLNAPISTDKSISTIKCAIENKTKNIDISIDFDSFIAIVTRNESGRYRFIYQDGHWNSDSYNFTYVTQGETYYYPIDVVGISFVYNDETSETPAIDFVDGDTIEVYAPLQKTISLRAMYNVINGLGLYVDEDGDVCQED